MKDVHISVIQFHYSLFGVVVFTLYVLSEAFYMKGIRVYSFNQYMQMIAFTSCNFISVTFNTMALKLEKTGVIGVMLYI